MTDDELDVFLGLQSEPQSEVKKSSSKPKKTKASASKPAAPSNKVSPKANSEFDQYERVQSVLDGGILPDAPTFRKPVTLTFIATVLGTEPRRLANKLSKCPIAGVVESGRFQGNALYDFKTALQYVVEPKVDMADWIKSQSSTTLPPLLNKAFWEAERTKMRVMQEAGDLWITEDVQRAFGEIAKIVRDSTQIWIEKLPGAQEMSGEQYDALRRSVSDLQVEIFEKVKHFSTVNVTTSYRAEIEKLGASDDDADA